MGRRVGTVLLGMLVLAGCAAGDPEPSADPVKTFPTAFDVPDPAHDAESTATGFVPVPNVDLLGIGAQVGHDGIRLGLRYAQDWTTEERARWGARFEIVGSDGNRISAAFTYDPAVPGLVRDLRLVPAPSGCVGSARLHPEARRLVLELSPGCLPMATAAEPRPWILFDSLESVTSWHDGGQILYGWDQLYERVVAPEPQRLFLPGTG